MCDLSSKPHSSRAVLLSSPANFTNSARFLITRHHPAAMSTSFHHSVPETDHATQQHTPRSTIQYLDSRIHPASLYVPSHSEIASWSPEKLSKEIVARIDTKTMEFVMSNLPSSPPITASEFLQYGGDRSYWLVVRCLRITVATELTFVARMWQIPQGFFYEEGKKDNTSRYWLSYHSHLLSTSTGFNPPGIRGAMWAFLSFWGDRGSN